MDFQKYCQDLQSNTEQLVNYLQSHVSAEQGKVKPPSGWSVLEIVEHLFLTEKVVMKVIQTEGEITDTEELFGDGKMEHLLLNKREVKIDAPAFVKPRGLFSTMEEALDAWKTQRDYLVQRISKEKIKADKRAFKHPFLGDMTVADWLYLIVHHSRRHQLQIEEMRG
ncbi:MAG: hypothetical protein ACJAY8_001475 [Sphingobacteriales bacterium]|jgi:hypothetical protein